VLAQRAFDGGQRRRAGHEAARWTLKIQASFVRWPRAFDRSRRDDAGRTRRDAIGRRTLGRAIGDGLAVGAQAD
jgi:hypothetical protein